MTIIMDTPDPIILAPGETPPAAPGALLTMAEYAAKAGVSTRTMKRWLAADELPGAFHDERGHWRIPADAEHVVPEPPIQTPLGSTAMTQEVRTLAVAEKAPNLDLLPSNLPLEHAALLLSVTPHAITHHPEHYGAVKHGPNGAWLVPLATIKRVRGLIP